MLTRGTEGGHRSRGRNGRGTARARPIAFEAVIASFCALLPLATQAPPVERGYAETLLAAHAALDAGELERARDELDRCLELVPRNANCAYARAAVEGREGDVVEALAWLARAIEWGWSDAAVASWDPDLAAVRESPTFESLLARIGESAHAADGLPPRSFRWSWESAVGVLSPDGERVVLMGDDTWFVDRATELPLAILEGGWRTDVAFGPDGDWAVIEDPDGFSVVDAWSGVSLSTSGGEPRYQGWSAQDVARYLAGRRDVTAGAPRWLAGQRVDAVRVAPGGVHALARFWRGPKRVELRDIASGELLVRDTVHTELLAEPFEGTGRRVALSDGTSFVVYDTSSGQLVLACAGSGGRVVGARLDAERLSAVFDDGSAASWRLADGEREWASRLATDGDATPWDAELSADGSRAVVYSSSEQVQAFDLTSGRELWRCAEGWPLGGFRSDGTFPCYADGDAVLLDARSGRVVLRFGSALGSQCSVVVDGSRPRAAVANRAAIGLFDLTTASLVARLHRPGEEPWLSGFSPDGRWLAATSARHRALVWDLDSGALVLDEPARADWWRTDAIAFSPAGSRLALAADDGLAVYELASGARLLCIASTAPAIVRWSPDGAWLATADDEHHVTVRDASSGAALASARFHAWGDGLAFDPTGERLAVAGDGEDVYLWDWRERRVVRVFRHPDAVFGDRMVHDLAFSRDGTRLVATVGELWWLFAWDIDTGGAIWGWRLGHGGSPVPFGASLTADERRVLVEKQGGLVVDAESGEVLRDSYDEELFDAGFHVDTVLELSAGAGAVMTSPEGALVFGDVLAAPRYLLTQLPSGGHLAQLPGGYVTGTLDAVRSAWMACGTVPVSAEAWAPLLLDPKRVRAAAAGVEVRPVELPAPPNLLAPERRERVVAVDEGGVFVLEAIAEHPDGLLRFEVERDGARVPRAELERTTTFEGAGTRATLRYDVTSEGAAETTLFVRALARSGVGSRTALVTVRFGADR